MGAHRTIRPSISRLMHHASRAPWLWACLSACAFDPPAEGGLRLDPREPDYQFASSPSTGVDAGFGPEDAGNMPSVDGCKHVPAFTEHVTPRFTAKCMECHDGTKIKAIFRLSLLDVDDLSPAAQEMTCNLTLATTDLDAPEESTILTFLDPDNPETMHDFKFETTEEFAAYRDAVLTWLRLEVEAQQGGS